jgi:hypothetical protein
MDIIAKVPTATIFPDFLESLNFTEIQHLQQRRLIKPKRFVIIGQNLHKEAKHIDNSWDELSSEQKEELKKLAYGLLNPSEESGKLTYIWTSIYWLFIKLTGEEESFLFCLDALDCLVDSILNAIENEQIISSTILNDTLKEITSNNEFSEPLDERNRGR